MKIYAFNTIPDEWKKSILSSLKEEGVGRFGWSYEERHNLLTSHYGENGTGFLLDIEKGDYIVYINLPCYGRCILAKVVEGYSWREPMEDDFNHCIGIDPDTIAEFGRNDDIVSPLLSSRLKLQGKY